MSAFTTYSARAELCAIQLRHEDAEHLLIAFPRELEDRHAAPVSGDMLAVMKAELMPKARRRYDRARLIEKSEGCIG